MTKSHGAAGRPFCDLARGQVDRDRRRAGRRPCRARGKRHSGGAHLEVTPRQPGTPPLLSGVSFSLGAGERMAIVGKSGAGKSVLVKAVLGLLPPRLQVTSGQVRYGEIDL